jgi:hypothetical protein
MTSETKFDVTKIISESWNGAYISAKSSTNTTDTTGAQESSDSTGITDGLNHKGTNGVYYMTPTALNGWQLPLEPLVSISGSKKIVKTSLPGNTRRGTVKEIINTNDYSISIRGLLLNETSEEYPFKDVEKLKDLFEKNEAIRITNIITKTLEIENVVITGLKIPQMVGRPNAQTYELSCISDEDFVLIHK